MGIIYKATNISNGKMYIGKTIKTLEKRKSEHEKSKSTLGFHGALKKYGLDNFEWQIIDTFDSSEESNEKERFYINECRSFVGFADCTGYNRTLGGDGASEGSANVFARPDVREKIQGIWIGRKHSEETKQKISESNKGRKLSDGTKAKISLAGIGKPKPKGENHPHAVTYIIVDPDGNEFVITGMREFCRAHNLNAKLLRRVAKGLQEDHKGYKCRLPK